MVKVTVPNPLKPLNLILVSGRHFDPGQQSKALPRDRRLALDLAERGCRVRWVYPASDGGSDQETDGVLVSMVRTVVPGFRSVLARLNDPPLEQVLSRSIRADLPDVVHVLTYGSGASINVAWLADRLGAPSVVTVKGKEVLCHRGTLINERGEGCFEWRSARRCAECCLTPTPDGLGNAAAACGRLLARLRWVSPFPQDIDFQNRLELVTAGLVVARRVLVTTAQDARLLQEAGVKGAIVLEDAHDASALMEVYQGLRTPPLLSQEQVQSS